MAVFLRWKKLSLLGAIAAIKMNVKMNILSRLIFLLSMIPKRIENKVLNDPNSTF